VNATTAGTLGITGTADIDISVDVEAAGDLGLTGSATVVVTAPSDVTLAVAGALGLTGSASVTVDVSVAAAGSLGMTGSATVQVASSSVAVTVAGSLGMTGSATVVVFTQSAVTVAGAVGLTGVATLVMTAGTPPVGDETFGHVGVRWPRKTVGITVLPHTHHSAYDGGVLDEESIPSDALGSGTPDETMVLHGDRVWRPIDAPGADFDGVCAIGEVARAGLPASGSGLTEHWDTDESAWTWLQQESGTSSVDGGILTLSHPTGQVGGAIKGLYRAIPSPTSEWVFRVACAASAMPLITGAGIGIFLYELSTGKTSRYNVTYNTGGAPNHRIDVFHHTAINTFSTAPFTPRSLSTVHDLRAAYDLEIRRTSTSISYHYRDSPGGPWSTLGSETETTPFTTRATHVGVFITVPNTATVTGRFGAFLQIA
jgi:hypothetical protein